MAIPATLADIETKVRRLTRSPSVNQLSQAELQNYINTFVVYDFPEHLRTFNLRTQFTFTCNPYQDVYATDILSFGGAPGAINNALYNFQNLFLTIHQPIYIAGFQALYSQSREQFLGIYPNINSIQSIGTAGNGVTTQFTGTVNSAGINTNNPPRTVLLKNEVLFSSVDINNNGLSFIDSPILDSTTGNPTNFGILYDPNNPPVLPLLLAAPYNTQPGFPATNNINYLTGAFTITFATAPANGQAINSQTVPEITALPLAMLYFNNEITLRPVPDQPYRINFEAYMRPTALLAGSLDGQPGLTEWWQYIAYGAAKKIFEDRMDIDSVQMIMPEFKKQENMVNRRTIVQYTNERTATIYTENAAGAYGPGWGYGGGNF